MCLLWQIGREGTIGLQLSTGQDLLLRGPAPLLSAHPQIYLPAFVAALPNQRDAPHDDEPRREGLREKDLVLFFLPPLLFGI